MFELQSSDLNQDGSVTAKIGGMEVRLVRESDLGAVKAAKESADKEVTRLQTELAGANTKLGDMNQNFLKVSAELENTKAAATELPTVKATMEKLQSEMAGLTESSGKLSAELADSYRNRLVTNHKVDAEKIKDMDLGTLRSTLSAFALSGNGGTPPANYDGSGPAGGSPSSLEGKSPLQLAAEGYEQSGKNN